MPHRTGPRLWQLDALRGLALVNMVAYHALYDWVYVFGLPCAWYDISAPGCHIWQQYICWSFLLIAGFSFTLSRAPLKNGLLTLGCAAVLTVVTAVFLPGQAIWFGVLHLTGCALVLTALLRPVWQRIPPAAGLAVSAAAFALLNQLPSGWLGFEGLRLVRLPAALYRPNWFWLGLPDLSRFSSADYFPLLPWLFLFCCGYFIARLCGRERLRAAAAPPPAALRGLCCAGRHTLLLYMLHQPVVYGALWLYAAHNL